MKKRLSNHQIFRVVKTYPYTSLETAPQSKRKHAMGISPLKILVANSCWRGRALPKNICLGASAAPAYGRTTQLWRTICQAPSAQLRSCSRKNHHIGKINPHQHKTKGFLSKHPMPVGIHAKASTRKKKKRGKKKKRKNPSHPQNRQDSKTLKKHRSLFFTCPFLLALQTSTSGRLKSGGTRHVGESPRGLSGSSALAAGLWCSKIRF